MVTLICLILTILGSLNWLILGIFSFNLVTAIVGAGVGARIIYCIIGISALWLIGIVIWKKGKISSI